ncbi:hypothetical protein EHS25_006926 [Saitozyma podzolica]|uniref:DASH complex subunit DAD1 n=1 Tax=Saitozyma podzolica TaxID=1890683 RepID=A0A427XRC9_9TREE|nr:hypothetical protein EHS25_006926 [Saitozyma podzolica]
MALARQSTAYDPALQPEATNFFDRERDRLVDEISANFEELMTHANVLNRKLEEVHGVGKEFSTVAELWGRFNTLIRDQQTELAAAADVGVPGTGRANFGASAAR